MVSVNELTRSIATDLGVSLPKHLHRRQFLGGLIALGLTAGCGSSPTASQPVPKAAGGSPTAPAPLTLTLANSELAVGQNRFALGVLVHGRPLPDAELTYEFFQVSGQSAVKRAESQADYRALDSQRGIYVANVVFDTAGPWGVQATVLQAGQSPLAARTGFEVLAHGHAPMPGQPAVPSRTLTASEVASLREICSGEPPCGMHEISLANALTRQIPLVVTFSTPGFCTSQLCAPVLTEVERVRARRAASAQFVHVEIYKDPRTLTAADAVQQWGLKSEPWVFVVDRNGRIAQRMESITTADEIDAALETVL
jgi:hypothetical protein